MAVPLRNYAQSSFRIFSVILLVFLLFNLTEGSKTKISKSNDTESLNCTPHAVDKFPFDLFTREQRRNGGFLFNLLLIVFICGSIAIVCDDYFVPVMHQVSEALSLPPDIAGATFMAAGTSCPELFVSLIGAFLTEGDIGIGTVLGAAIANTLAIVAVCGLFAGSTMEINWRPLVRDCIVYVLAIGLIIFILSDEEILWYEALCLLLLYLAYIVILSLNAKFEKWCKVPLRSYDVESAEQSSASEEHPQTFKPKYAFVTITTSMHTRVRRETSKSSTTSRETSFVNPMAETEKNPETYFKADPETGQKNEDSSETSSEEFMEVEDESSLTKIPDGSWLKKGAWFFWWPVNALFRYTIPNPQKQYCCNLLPLSFVMCIIYIGLCSYFATWMVTVLGHAFDIPDSVLGMTFLALGDSLPELVSSIIVAKQSLGNMALANAMGSNIFNLLVCLGVPWIVKGAMGSKVLIHSEGLSFISIGLLLSVVLMLVCLAINRFRLKKTVGATCGILYLVTISLACMYEMNVFSNVNLPICKSV